MEKLTREISIDELPTNFGGTLSYDHEKWIKFRTVKFVMINNYLTRIHDYDFETKVFDKLYI